MASIGVIINGGSGVGTGAGRICVCIVRGRSACGRIGVVVDAVTTGDGGLASERSGVRRVRGVGSIKAVSDQFDSGSQGGLGDGIEIDDL